MKRAIILSPRFENINLINDIRVKYDPLVNCINPHITIVFPFDSDISPNDLKSHINNVLNSKNKFFVQLKGFTGDYKDGYLFLNVKKGNDEIIDIHDKLYSGILKKFLNVKITYFPHLTVGKLQQSNEFDKAIYELQYRYDTFETIIDKVIIENIDINDNSIIEYTYKLH